MTDERLVALRIEFDQLQSDRKALKKGEAGYLLSPGRLQTLDIRIATVRDELARIEPLNPDWRQKRETPPGRRQPD